MQKPRSFPKTVPRAQFCLKSSKLGRGAIWREAVRVVVLNGYTALGIPVTKPVE